MSAVIRRCQERVTILGHPRPVTPRSSPGTQRRLKYPHPVAVVRVGLAGQAGGTHVAQVRPDVCKTADNSGSEPRKM